MAKRLGIVFIGLIVTGALAVTLLNMAARKHLDMKAQHLDGAIAKAHLLGQSPNRVSAFLDQQGIAHSPYVRENKVIPEASRMLSGSIEDVASTLDMWYGPATWDIRLEFKFDHNDRLVSYQVWASPVGF